MIPSLARSSRSEGTPWIEIKGADAHMMTFYTTGADGKERKTGELSYKRKDKK